MGTLWTFGDSLTAPFDKKYEWSRNYLQWKGYDPKVYPNLISEKLNLQLNNLAIPGSDNYSIFQTFCNISHKIKKDDVVIFGWSSPIRFRLATKYNTWKTFIPNYSENQADIEGVSPESINEILLNRENLNFSEEVNSWIKLIETFLGDIKNVQWTTFDHRLNAHMIRNLQTIRVETNGEVDDGHFSEKGHVELSEILMTHLTMKKNKSLI